MIIKNKSLGSIIHYIGVVFEYIIITIIAFLLNNMLKLPKLFNIYFKILGCFIILFGGFLISWSVWLQFKLGKETTSFSEPTKKLVTYGLYGIIRNPMMEGQYLFFAGIGFILDLIAMFLILPILILSMHIIIIFLEEPDLKKRFGQEWIEYTKNVPRYLPRFKNMKKEKNEKY